MNNLKDYILEKFQITKDSFIEKRDMTPKEFDDYLKRKYHFTDDNVKDFHRYVINLHIKANYRFDEDDYVFARRNWGEDTNNPLYKKIQELIDGKSKTATCAYETYVEQENKEFQFWFVEVNESDYFPEKFMIITTDNDSRSSMTDSKTIADVFVLGIILG